MRLLLDTSVLLWMLDGSERLRRPTREMLNDRDSLLFVSVVSLWEIGIKIAAGKLRIDADWVSVLSDWGLYALLPVEVPHALAAPRLPAHHKDPFDRMLIAQALVEELTLVSTDRAFALYDAPLILA